MSLPLVFYLHKVFFKLRLLKVVKIIQKVTFVKKIMADLEVFEANLEAVEVENSHETLLLDYRPLWTHYVKSPIFDICEI